MGFLLHLLQYMTDHVFLIVFKVQLLNNEMVILTDLRGRKTYGIAACPGVVLDQVDYCVDGPVHRSSVLAVCKTEICTARQLAVQCDCHDVLDKLIYTFPLAGGNGDNRNTERAFKCVYVYCAAVLPHLIHHIERDDHRLVQLHELCGEVKIPLYVGGINDVYYTVNLVLDDEIAGDDLF